MPGAVSNNYLYHRHQKNDDPLMQGEEHQQENNDKAAIYNDKNNNFDRLDSAVEANVRRSSAMSIQNPPRQQAENEPLLFVLHVGLPKTATTHLQCSLCANPNFTLPLLRQDQWVYLGTCPIGECGHQYYPKQQRQDSVLFQKLTKEQRQRQRRQERRQRLQSSRELFLLHSHGSFFKGTEPVLEAGSNPVGPFPHALDPQRIEQGLQERRLRRQQQQAPWLDFNQTTTIDVRSMEQEEQPLPELTVEFRQRIDSVRRQGFNAMVIFEGADAWSHRHIQVLRDFLQYKNHWQVHVVVAYRPLFDWLPSKYNSIIKPSRNRAARIWPGHSINVGYVTNNNNSKKKNDDDSNNEDNDDTSESDKDGGRSSSATIVGEAIDPFRLDHLSAGHSPYLQKSTGSDELFSDFIHDIEVKYRMHPTQIVQHNYLQYFDNVHIMSLSHLNHELVSSAKRSTKHVTDQENSGAVFGESSWFGRLVGLGDRESNDHGGDPLLHYLFCQMLPGRMPHTCQSIERTGQSTGTDADELPWQTSSAKTANPSLELDYDILAVEAYKQGLIHVKRIDGDMNDNSRGVDDEQELQPTRDAVAGIIRRYQLSRKGQNQISGSSNDTNLDFPLQCLDNGTLNRMETLSWHVENRLFFGDGSAGAAAARAKDQARAASKPSNQHGQQKQLQVEFEKLHHAGFTKAIVKQKFCSIDAKKTLQDPQWRQWFVANFQENLQSNEQRTAESHDSAGKHLPLFILHVGLPKTATTHLQCSLCANPSVTEPILEQDKLVYLGTCPIQCNSNLGDKYLKHHQLSFFQRSPLDPNANPLGPFPHALDPERSKKVNTKKIDKAAVGVPKLNQAFVDRVEEIRDKGLGVMIVFEGCSEWSARHISTLAKYLKKQNRWEVHIIVAYRPLYEWLPSKYNSVVKPMRNRAARLWPGRYDKKLGVVGEEILPFDLDNRSAGNAVTLRRHGGDEKNNNTNDDFNGFGDFVYEIEVQYRMHPAHILYENYHQHFDNVHIMSLPHINYVHETSKAIPSKSDPLLSFLFCHMLPPANLRTTCSAVRSGRIGGGEKALQRTSSSSFLASAYANPSMNLDYDILAVQAFKDGWIPAQRIEAGTTRADVRSRIQQYKEIELAPLKFPQQCLGNVTLTRLETLSWLVERKFLFTQGNHTVAQRLDLPMLAASDGQNHTMNATESHEVILEKFERLHRSGFVRAQPKFCSIDAKKTLQLGEWRKFFVANFWSAG
ncbi:hypothetical protein ACA910_007981 [Epithemia clementina (nom. ined.)]